MESRSNWSPSDPWKCFVAEDLTRFPTLVAEKTIRQKFRRRVSKKPA